MEKWEIVISICSAILGSTALVSLVQFLINRHDKKKEDKKDKWDEVNEKLDSSATKQDRLAEDMSETKIDLTRTNLLLLMASYPKNVSEILYVARKYFVDYKGDAYVTPIFSQWLIKQGIDKPVWFDDEE